LKHRHHIIPRHAGGDDSANNIEVLSIPEHADAHRVLYEKYGRWQDKVAYLSLSKQISCADATRIACSLANKGKPKSDITKAKLSKCRKGVKMSDAARENMRVAMIGRKHPEEVRIKIGMSQRGKTISPSAIEAYRKSRQLTDGTTVKIGDNTFGSFSAAADYVKDAWNVNKETAKARIVRLHNKGVPIPEFFVVNEVKRRAALSRKYNNGVDVSDPE
jgi:hypothetical protein